MTAMFSEQHFLRNLDALEQVQGHRPALAPLDARTPGALETGGTDPEAEARELLAAVGDAAHILLIGGAAGHMLDGLERSGASTKVVVLEPDPGTAARFLARRDWRPWLASGRLRLLTGPGYVGASSTARLVNGAKPTAIVVNDALAAHRPADVEPAMRVARRIQQDAVANADARRQFAGRYLLQTLGNLPVIERESNIAALDGGCTGRPAVVVAAGPSLDASLAALAAYQEQVVIIASDTTLRPLLAAGIRPHLMVAVDPAELNARHLSGVPDTSGIWLAAEGSLHPDAYRSFAGRTFIFKVSDHEPWPWLRDAGLDRGQLRAWGSVATSAFDLALRMGCAPIIFAGHDFAYTNDRPYCDNTVFHEEAYAYLKLNPTGNIRHYEEMLMQGQPLVTATDVHGAPVRTAARLLAFRDWIAEQTTTTRDRRFINATGGGILQGPGIEQMPLDLALGVHAGPAFDARHVLTTAYRRGLAHAGPRSELTDAVIARWIEFTANTVDAAAIRQALL